MLLKCTPLGVWRQRMLRKSPPCVYITPSWEQSTNRHEQDSAHRTNKVIIKWKQAPDSARQLLCQFTRWRVGGKKCDQNLWGIIIRNFNYLWFSDVGFLPHLCTNVFQINKFEPNMWLLLLLELGSRIFPSYCDLVAVRGDPDPTPRHHGALHEPAMAIKRQKCNEPSQN